MAPFAPARTRPSPLRPALRLLAAAALTAHAPAFAQARMPAQTQQQARQQTQQQKQKQAKKQAQPQPQTQAEEQAAPPERTLPQVVVQAQRLARDGISDSTAYTTRGAQVAGKTPRALREIPQSVTVFTEQRLRDQAQADVTRVLEWVPGVFNGLASETDTSRLYSRGFRLDNLSIDGSLAGTSFWQIPADFSAYDQVEVLRGPNGLFAGGGSSGSPAGHINLTRKRPQDTPHVLGEAALGSWQQHRASVDVNRRLLADGSLGVRLIASQANRAYFFRTARRRNTTLYGVAEWQPLATLTLTAGAELERRRALPWITGLPLRGDGAFPGYPRRMSTASPWSKWAIDTQGFFAETVWKWRENWQLKAAWNWRREKGDWDFGFLSGYVDPVPGSSQMALYQNAQRRLFPTAAARWM
ncbi:TonB-dependent receptor plug domain-containing protein [uncultured Ottowia sp.]|uniref:TonB-dependent siderophore receptor n=1 Tax=uncultured Ottowia sp. TaxID=543067 RepID=UPI00259A00D3|nr:TonB-dependent receptor plug domain-containing protein [uncultured Ottowia sp.]